MPAPASGLQVPSPGLLRLRTGGGTLLHLRGLLSLLVAAALGDLPVVLVVMVAVGVRGRSRGFVLHRTGCGAGGADRVLQGEAGEPGPLVSARLPGGLPSVPTIHQRAGQGKSAV